jgi:hypothetical protein
MGKRIASIFSADVSIFDIHHISIYVFISSGNQKSGIINFNTEVIYKGTEQKRSQSWVVLAVLHKMEKKTSSEMLTRNDLVKPLDVK